MWKGLCQLIPSRDRGRAIGKTLRNKRIGTRYE